MQSLKSVFLIFSVLCWMSWVSASEIDHVMVSQQRELVKDLIKLFSHPNFSRSRGELKLQMLDPDQAHTRVFTRILKNRELEFEKKAQTRGETFQSLLGEIERKRSGQVKASDRLKNHELVSFTQVEIRDAAIREILDLPKKYLTILLSVYNSEQQDLQFAIMKSLSMIEPPDKRVLDIFSKAMRSEHYVEDIKLNPRGVQKKKDSFSSRSREHVAYSLSRYIEFPKARHLMKRATRDDNHRVRLHLLQGILETPKDKGDEAFFDEVMLMAYNFDADKVLKTIEFYGKQAAEIRLSKVPSPLIDLSRILDYISQYNPKLLKRTERLYELMDQPIIGQILIKNQEYLEPSLRQSLFAHYLKKEAGPQQRSYVLKCLTDTDAASFKGQVCSIFKETPNPQVLMLALNLAESWKLSECKTDLEKLVQIAQQPGNTHLKKVREKASAILTKL